jgi:hypothetical protein
MAATKSPITRRRALAGTAGLAGSLAMNVGQAKDNEQPQSSYNPLDKYPAPPFKRQSQPWPGLASRMDPPPDDGERTYRGSGTLAGSSRFSRLTLMQCQRHHLFRSSQLRSSHRSQG